MYPRTRAGHTYSASPTFERFLSRQAPAYEKLSFWVMQHAANRLHYSLRLEFAGMAMTWAIYPGPSLNPFESRTAIQMEDRFLNGARSEKVSPDTGITILWDEGSWIPHPAQRFRDQFRFTLHGLRLKGDWELRLKHIRERPQWTLWKVADEFASKEEVLKHDTSIRSGLTMEDYLRRHFPPAWMETLPEELPSSDHVRNQLILKVREEILAEKLPWPVKGGKHARKTDLSPTLFPI